MSDGAITTAVVRRNITVVMRGDEGFRSVSLEGTNFFLDGQGLLYVGDGGAHIGVFRDWVGAYYEDERVPVALK